MQLLPAEENLVTSNQDKLILTNQRIHLTDKQWGRSYQITIFLENIASIENVYKSNPVYLLIMAGCLLLALATASRELDEKVSIGSFVAAVICLLLWNSSRRHVVTISSNGGGTLNFSVEGMGDDQVQDFIDKVEAAKGARMNQLFRH
jgi:hypothetical protein